VNLSPPLGCNGWAKRTLTLAFAIICESDFETSNSFAIGCTMSG
jgi:hypothetical protein